MLSTSLGGNTKTTMIVTASSRFEDFDQSINTFVFATNAKKIQNIAKINVIKSVQPMQLMFKCRNFKDIEDRGNEPLPELEEYGIIFKNGDDLRQD